MTGQMRDALRHLEKDMADILDVLLDNQTTEVILNPYQAYDGRYIGYILVDQHGRGLQNLIRHYEEDFDSSIIKDGDTIIFKAPIDSPENILFWTKLGAEPTSNLKKISICIKSNLSTNSITQSSEFNILNYCEMLEGGYIGPDRQLSLESANLTNIIQEINQTLPSIANFKLYSLIIKSDIDYEQFPIQPRKLIRSELVKMTASRAETIMSVLASITGKYLHNKQPYLECQIPHYGHRFTVVIPPVVSFPAFCIRKHAPQIYSLNASSIT